MTAVRISRDDHPDRAPSVRALYPGGLRATALAATTLLAIQLLSLAGPLRAQEASEDSLRSHTRALAHDSLLGRRPGTRGERQAAAYLTDRLEALGLEPLPGSPGMRLPVPLTVHSFGERAAIRVRSEEGGTTLRPPDFYHPGGSPRSFQDFGGELLLAGSVPGALEALAGVDLVGKTVLLGPPWWDVGAVEAELILRGAAGALEAVPNSRAYDRLRIVRGPDRFSLPPEIDDEANQSSLPRVVVGPDALGVLGLAEAVSPGDTTARPMRTGLEIQVHLDESRRSVTGHNVAAILPGSEPGAREAVLYMAHYDHVGLGEAVAGDSIWNGFADNASGVAVLLEVARILAADPPPRPVIFLFTTAEEQGLLGATWFAHTPPFPTERIAGVINVDGGIPSPGVSEWQVAAPDSSRIRRLAAGAIREAGWTVRERAIRPDSDHWAFHERGVPSLFLYPGSLADGLRVHTADDEWRPDAPFEGLVRYVAAALAVGRRLAD